MCYLKNSAKNYCTKKLCVQFIIIIVIKIIVILLYELYYDRKIIYLINITIVKELVIFLFIFSIEILNS